MKRTLLLASLAIAFTATGCSLYFGPNDNDDTWSYCDSTGCYTCDDWGCTSDDPGGGGNGWDCYTNYDCAAGCYCTNSGYCEEAGFCSSDNDCANGMVCDDRASCVPAGSNGDCTDDSDCGNGEFCDELSGYCISSWSCQVDNDCGTGYECDDRGTCIPVPCTADDDCLAGCFCDTNSGSCIESGMCEPDGTCLDPGMECDVVRNTCTPCENGDCTPPPPTCEEIVDETECLGRLDCISEYNGINCTSPNGSTCTSGDANCTCESFVFDECTAGPLS